MPTNAEKYRSMLLLDNETDSLPYSGWLPSSAYTRNPTTGQVTLVGGGSGAVVYAGSLTPAALAAGQTDNYNPGDFSAVSRLRLSANAAGSQLSGLVASATDGQVVVIQNISANDLTLLAESASSTAANRFAINGDLILGANQSISLIYDTGIARWSVLGV